MSSLLGASFILFKLAKDYSNNFDLSRDMIEDICDVVYGDLLSKYINDKNMDDMQLTKKEHVGMKNSYFLIL